MKNWLLVIMVLGTAFLVVIFGVWGESWVEGHNGAVSNALRTLQWETLTAGLLGLAGGLCVIVATRRQMAQAERIARQQRVDFLLSDINAQLFEIEDICIASSGFIDEARQIIEDEKANTQEANAEVRKTMKKEANRNDFPMLVYVERGAELLKREKVPIVARKSFDKAWHNLRGLLYAWRGDFMAESLGDAIVRLEKSTAQLRRDLKKHKKRMLELRRL